MNEQEYYDQGQGYCDPAPTSNALTVPTIQPLAVSQVDNRFNRQLARRADRVATQERYKTQLAGEIIYNTTALSALGDAAIAAVPSAQHPVRHIINTYAASSAKRLAEGW